MLYTLLCYNKEDVVWSWSKEEDDAVMGRLAVVHEKLVKEGKLGPSLRLLPTTAATTLRAAAAGDRRPLCRDQGTAAGLLCHRRGKSGGRAGGGAELAAANPTSVYEIRPIALYVPKPDRTPKTIKVY